MLNGYQLKHFRLQALASEQVQIAFQTLYWLFLGGPSAFILSGHPQEMGALSLHVLIFVSNSLMEKTAAEFYAQKYFFLFLCGIKIRNVN